MYLVVDIETTGGNAKTGRIIEIAAIIYDGNKIVDTFETLINPEIQLPPFITKLTGIDSFMLSEAPKFYEISNKFLKFSQGHIFVAHNAHFDYSYIKEEYKNIGIVFERDLFCTLAYSKKLYPHFKSHGLDAVCRQFFIKNNNRHRAMGDALATTELLKIIIEDKGHP